MSEGVGGVGVALELELTHAIVMSSRESGRSLLSPSRLQNS